MNLTRPAAIAAILCLATAAPSVAASSTFNVSGETVTLTEGVPFIAGQDAPYIFAGDFNFFSNGGSVGSAGISLNGTNILFYPNVTIVNSDSNGYPTDEFYDLVGGGDYDFGPLGHVLVHGVSGHVYITGAAGDAPALVSLTLHDVPAAVPEPGAWTSISFGLLAVAGLVWKRRSAAY
jgi:hypothetical protein